MATESGWRDAATSQGMPRTFRGPQELGRGMAPAAPRSPRKNPPCPRLVSDVSFSELGEGQFLCLQATRLRSFVTTACGHEYDPDPFQGQHTFLAPRPCR